MNIKGKIFDVPLGNSDSRRVNSSAEIQVTPKRRELLKCLVVTTGGLLGFSGVADADGEPAWKDEARAAARDFGSEKNVKKLLSETSPDLLHALANDGYIDRPEVSALPLAIHQTPDSYGSSSEGVLVVATASDGNPSVKIQVKQQLSPGRRLVLHVYPNNDEIVATLVDEAAGETTLLTVDSSGDELEIVEDVCCYEWSRAHCGYGCSPYGNCTCVNYRICEFPSSIDPCPCEHLNGCQGCGDDSAC